MRTAVNAPHPPRGLPTCRPFAEMATMHEGTEMAQGQDGKGVETHQGLLPLITTPTHSISRPIATKGQTIAKTTSNDSLALTPGCLKGWEEAWPPGWAWQVVKQGHSWWWKCSPPLRRRSPFTKVRPNVVLHIQNMINQDVVEEVSGKVFLSHIFSVPQKNSEKDQAAYS